MRSACCIAFGLSALCFASCGGPVSSRVVRQQIATLGGAGLETDDVQVERVIAQGGNRAIAEATVQMAFEFERDSTGEWEIVAVRVGEDEWIDMATFLAALNEQQVRETTSDLAMLAAGVEAFRRQNGMLPALSGDPPLPDVLHPLFVPNLVRQDAWGSDFIYEALPGSVRLRSPGPDREPGTPDDIEVSTSLNP